MNIELHSIDLVNADLQEPQFQFVVDAELAHVGGGSVVVNY